MSTGGKSNLLQYDVRLTGTSRYVLAGAVRVPSQRPEIWNFPLLGYKLHAAKP